MDHQLPVPSLDPALITCLDARFPEACPDPSWTEREIWMKAGERRLVNWLKCQQRIQENDNVLLQAKENR